MFGFKRGLMIVGGGGALIVGTMFFQASDINKNYVRVDAVVTSVNVDCYVKSGNKRIVKKNKDELTYMNCAIAPYAAEKFGFKKTAIKKRAKVKYEYTSPADNDMHDGEFVKKRDIDKFKEGVNIKIYAHKEIAEKTKTPFGNFFIKNTDET